MDYYLKWDFHKRPWITNVELLTVLLITSQTLPGAQRVQI